MDTFRDMWDKSIIRSSFTSGGRDDVNNYRSISLNDGRGLFPCVLNIRLQRWHKDNYFY